MRVCWDFWWTCFIEWMRKTGKARQRPLLCPNLTEPSAKNWLHNNKLTLPQTADHNTGGSSVELNLRCALFLTFAFLFRILALHQSLGDIGYFNWRTHCWGRAPHSSTSICRKSANVVVLVTLAWTARPSWSPECSVGLRSGLLAGHSILSTPKFWR